MEGVLRSDRGSINEELMEGKEECIKGLGVLVLGADVGEESVDLSQKAAEEVAGERAESCAPGT